ncbi:MAG: alpha/beta hydrolase [Desulfobacteraceae bacterium]|nr:alpha/beta hydrolase [Desulfobacteraceae bacterium]
MMQNREAGGIGFVSGNWPLDPNKPTLIFIHGAALNKDCWEAQVKSLTEFVNTIAIDLPGHGTSRKPGKDNVSDYAQSVMGFIDIIKPPRPIPCGLSLGGAITQQLLINYKDSFHAGILINTGARLKVMPLIFEAIQKKYSDFVDMLCAFAISPKSDAEQLRAKIETYSLCQPDIALDDFRACDSFNVMEELNLIKVPILILTANDDNITPLKYGTFLEQNIKYSKLVNIEDAGHFSPIEKSHKVNKAIRDFLTQIRLQSNKP